MMNLDNNFSLSCTCFNQLYAGCAHFNCMETNTVYEYYNPTAFTTIGYRISGPNVIFCIKDCAKVCDVFDILYTGLALPHRSNIKIPFRGEDAYSRCFACVCNCGFISYLEYDGVDKICILGESCGNIYTLCRSCDTLMCCTPISSNYGVYPMKFYAIDPTFYFEWS